MRQVAIAVLVSSALLLIPAPTAAQEGGAPWQPVAPDGSPADFDWIRLPSDEWLKGEIISMYDGDFEFDSDELGMLTFDFDDLKEIRSAQVVQVGFEDGPPVVGRLVLDADAGRVIGDSGEVEFPRERILTLIVGTPKEINYWSAYASLGGNIRSGNTDQVDYSARFGTMRRSLKNRINLDYLGNITRIDSEDTSNNHRVNLGWDHFLSKRLFISVVGAEWYRDEFQNIANRWTVGAGVGYEIVDTSRTTWRASAGPAWQSTEYVSVDEDEDDTADSPAFGIGSRFDHEITGDIDYYLDYKGFFTDRDSGTYNHHVDTGIDLELTSRLDITLSWIWDRIQDPRPLDDGTVPKQDDYRLIFGLGWDF